ncbi:hypothetical protein BDZ45DRAFT_675660 [Acephala macrosclerotiorum]|nr:hypothetical protein BDZ45DRAFT_675660 [Acephala macrosclerotiorum]
MADNSHPRPTTVVPSDEADIVDTDFLIVGAGIAGSALASFLASYGLKAIMISNTLGTSETPRAHLLNMAGMECLRHIGLEEDCLKVGYGGDALSTIRWCRSMVGEEFARVHAWGAAPSQAGAMEAASPCRPLDLPQTELEPILVRYATHHGVSCLFNTSFVDFSRDSNFVVSTVKNNVSRQTFRIRSRYLFGCDGARSLITRSLNISFSKNPSMGVAYNVLFNADLGHVMSYNKGHLHWIMQPGKEHKFGLAPVMRMVKPWKQWILVCFPQPGVTIEDFQTSPQTNDALVQHVKEAIGDLTIPVEILSVSGWKINDTVAETYSDGGNIFCLGDAVHRHPPVYGLGSNTCIQDAYNLAWKVAYVTKGFAGSALLDSYSEERQPVGHTIVKEANAGLRAHSKVWESLGMFGDSIEERLKQNAELSESTAAGVARRAQLSAAVKNARAEADSFGIMMNQWYKSNAVFLEDEGPRPPLIGDPITVVNISTYPGNRLPHSWLSQGVSHKPISTTDLAGDGSFCLLTGHGGDAWKQAATKAATILNIPIRSFSIGWGLDYHDIYLDWHVRRQIEEEGCILVRPDGFVAWRSSKMIADCEGKLLRVLKYVLSR